MFCQIQRVDFMSGECYCNDSEKQICLWPCAAVEVQTLTGPKCTQFVVVRQFCKAAGQPADFREKLFVFAFHKF